MIYFCLQVKNYKKGLEMEEENKKEILKIIKDLKRKIKNDEIDIESIKIENGFNEIDLYGYTRKQPNGYFSVTINAKRKNQ